MVVRAVTAGIFSGCASAQTMMYPENSAASSTPGMMPAMNSCAIDTFAVTPYTIMMIDGGISRPSVPAPASVPIVMSSGYPRALNSGSVIFPMVAQVAAEDPDTAAKIVQPMMLVCSRRPGSRSSQGASPLNMSSDNRVRNRISPIQQKSGSAVSVHDEAVPQIVTAMASPAGRDEKSSIPIHATPASANPIQTPLPSSAKSATMSSVVTAASFIV